MIPTSSIAMRNTRTTPSRPICAGDIRAAPVEVVWNWRNGLTRGRIARFLVHVLPQLFTFCLQSRDQLLVAVIIDHPIKLITVVRDQTNRVDREVVNTPLAAALIHQRDRAEDLSIIGAEIGLLEESHIGGFRLLAYLFNRRLLHLAQVGVLEKFGEQRHILIALGRREAAPMITERRFR